MEYILTETQRAAFQQDGFLVLRDFFTSDAIDDLKRHAQEVHDWHTDASSRWMPYEEVNAYSQRVLRRTENFVESHPALVHSYEARSCCPC